LWSLEAKMSLPQERHGSRDARKTTYSAESLQEARDHTATKAFDGDTFESTPNGGDRDLVEWHEEDADHPWNWKRSRKWGAISIGV
jgi:hypothetical protein